MRRKDHRTYQPATVATEFATGSEPAAAREAYLIVELSRTGVPSLRIAKSLSISVEFQSGWRWTEAMREVTPPESRFYERSEMVADIQWNSTYKRASSD